MVRLIILWLCLLPFLAGCEPVPSQPALLSPATLVYMVADNNLDYYAILNIRQMERGLPDNVESPVFVFIDRARGANPSHPYLLKIVQNTDNSITMSPILQVYRELNTSDPQVLRQVINDVKKYCARYGAELRRLILWSHGTGWLPEGTPFNELDDDDFFRNSKSHISKNRASNPNYSFGLDYTGSGEEEHKKEMDIKDLARVLEGERFELLIMDACFMGTIEVAYELRHIFDYMLVSPTEILAGGFPYEDIMGFLTASVIDPLAIAVRFFDYYFNQKGALQSAAITMVDSRYLENLAKNMETIYLDYIMVKDGIPIEQFIQYDRTFSNYFFDIKNFILAVSEHTKNDYTNIVQLYNKVVPFYLRTEKVFDVLDLLGTSGLSIYIPNLFTNRSTLHEYYQNLSWAQDSKAVLLFN